MLMMPHTIAMLPIHSLQAAASTVTRVAEHSVLFESIHKKVPCSGRHAPALQPAGHSHHSQHTLQGAAHLTVHRSALS